MKNIIKNIVLISLPVNFFWEMAQMPLYKNMLLNFKSTVFCLVASIGDAIMITVLYIWISVVLKNLLWIRSIGKKEVSIIIGFGFLIAIVVEFIGLSLHLWEYGNLMPIVLNGIGISPILQMIILPVVVFILTKFRLQNSLVLIKQTNTDL